MKNFGLLFALSLLLCLAAFFVFRSAYKINHQKYFALMDDEMISMRYANNLAHGEGMVWNQREHVEGVTNFLWVIYMAFFHLFPIPHRILSLFIQLSCVLFLLLNILFLKKLADLLYPKLSFITWFSIFLTASYVPILMWAVQGAETCALLLITTTTLYITCKNLKKGNVSFLTFILLTIGTQIRLDYILIALVITLFHLWKAPNKKKVLSGLFFIGAFIFLQTIFRLIYFHDFFPNTYYLKMIGYPVFLRITTGIYITFLFITNANWILFLIPFFSLTKKNSYTLLLFLVYLTQLFYNIYIGGDIASGIDVFSNRFTSVIMPIFFLLLSVGLWNILRNFKEIFSIFPHWITVLLASVFFLLVCASFNNFSNPNTWQNFYAHEELGYVPANKYNTEKALLIDTITTKNARIAVFWAGTTPYFSKRHYIDLLGKNDSVIAHEKVNPSYIPSDSRKYIIFNPGHTKWDFQYSLFTLYPDISDSMSSDSNSYHLTTTQLKLLHEKYQEIHIQNKTFYILKKSPNIVWSEIEQLQKNK